MYTFGPPTQDENYGIGDRVKAWYEGVWYPGVVESITVALYKTDPFLRKIWNEKAKDNPSLGMMEEFTRYHNDLPAILIRTDDLLDDGSHELINTAISERNYLLHEDELEYDPLDFTSRIDDLDDIDEDVNLPF